MKIGARELIVIAVVAVLAVAALFAVFVIVPQFSRLSEIGRQEEDTRAAIQQADNLIRQRQSAKSTAAQTQAELIRVANRMPDAPQLPSLIVELQDAANESGMQFIEIEPKEQLAKGGFTAVKATLSVRGRWVDCIEYMRRVWKMTREVRVTGVKFKPVEGDDAGTTPSTEVNGSVDVEVYYEGAPPDSATQPAQPRN